jgi:hypothetical protein
MMQEKQPRKQQQPQHVEAVMGQKPQNVNVVLLVMK